MEPKLIAPVAKPFDDFARPLRLIEFDWDLCVFKVSRPRKVALRVLSPLCVVGKLPVCVFVVCARCYLQVGNRFRIPHVRITATTPVKIARIRQYGDQVLVSWSG